MSVEQKVTCVFPVEDTYLFIDQVARLWWLPSSPPDLAQCLSVRECRAPLFPQILYRLSAYCACMLDSPFREPKACQES